MAITFEAFDFTFKRLCSALGKSYTKAQCEQYFEDLKDDLESSERWGKIASWWRRNRTTFPKISEVLALDMYREQRVITPQDDPAQRFLEDDCRVKECRGGFIRVDRPRYSPISYNCPECNRGKRDIPSLPSYRGPLTFHSPEEMATAKAARREVVFQQREQLAVAAP